MQLPPYYPINREQLRQTLFRSKNDRRESLITQFYYNGRGFLCLGLVEHF